MLPFYHIFFNIMYIGFGIVIFTLTLDSRLSEVSWENFKGQCFNSIMSCSYTEEISVSSRSPIYFLWCKILHSDGKTLHSVTVFMCTLHYTFVCYCISSRFKAMSKSKSS